MSVLGRYSNRMIVDVARRCSWKILHRWYVCTWRASVELHSIRIGFPAVMLLNISDTVYVLGRYAQCTHPTTPDSSGVRMNSRLTEYDYDHPSIDVFVHLGDRRTLGEC